MSQLQLEHQEILAAARALQQLLGKVEQLLPAAPEPDWHAAVAFRWRRVQHAFGSYGCLQALPRLSAIAFNDLQNVADQKEVIEQNTRQFVSGFPANNVLLTGSRGTGKSSLIKACLNEFSARGLRLIEVDKEDLTDLPDIIDLVATRH
jgi:uncharacterized protein